MKEFFGLESEYHILLDGVKLPEIKKIIGADGTEKVFDEEYVREAFCHAIQIAADYKYTNNDFNDVVTLLESGKNAVVVVVECNGENRAERAVKELVERVESTGCSKEQICSWLLHIQFVSAEFKPTGKEYCFIRNAFIQRITNECDIMMGFSDGVDGKGDFWRITTIAVY